VNEGARCKRGSVQTNEIRGRVTIGFPVLLIARSGDATGKRRFGRPPQARGSSYPSY
jgi:hypothetical protein